MYFVFIAFALCILIAILAKFFPKEKNLDIDILNENNEIIRLEAMGISDIRIFRKRVNSNLRMGDISKLIPLGEYNDVPDAKFFFNTVQDTAIIVKAKDAKGNFVIIKTYEYNPENKMKALRLKGLIKKNQK